jgi:hypothetical protein
MACFLTFLPQIPFMEQPDNSSPAAGNTAGPSGGNMGAGDHPKAPFETQEKTTLGGKFNSGVTSDDPGERDEIEKQGAMANINQRVPGEGDEERQSS